MKQELKEKWLVALRSGRYQQGLDNLRGPDNRYCCLGVLCDVAGLEWTLDEEEGVWKCPAGRDSITNDSIREKLGLPHEIHEAAYCLNDGTKTSIENSLHNEVDGLHHSFDEIADWLETYL